MRKFVYAALGAAAIASASIANAAVTVTSSSNLTDPNPTTASSVAVVDGVTTINFGQNPVGPGSFTSSFIFNNSVAGMYDFLIGSSTPGLSFTDVTLRNATTNALIATLAPPASRVLTLDGLALAANTNYALNITGTSALAGAISGNITITSAAVPEPATWGMMILGFGAMGLMIRRRRRPVLAQVA